MKPNFVSLCFVGSVTLTLVSCKTIVGPDYVDERYFGVGAGIAVRKGDALREKLNAAIKAIRDNGTYKKINDTYFTFDVFGG